MIGSLLNGLGMSLVGAKPYKTFEDLRGKTIGSQTLTTGPDSRCVWCCACTGLNIRETIRFSMSAACTDRYLALQSGQIAATR